MSRGVAAKLAAIAAELAAVAARLAEDVADPGELVPLADAAREAATSVRVVREAIASGNLPAFGGQRDRSVRRRDLAAWTESRRVKPIAGIDDRDIEARVRRIDSARRAGGAR